MKRKANTTNFYIGTSGIVVPLPQSQYPQAFKGKSRLSFYSRLLNSLEVNSSFYKNPQASTVAKWTAEVGEGFTFTFKIPKTISHAKDLQFSSEEVAEFISLVNSIGNKKACLLLQLPPKLSIASFQQLEELLLQLHSAAHEWKIAVEFRHLSWHITEVDELLAEYNACMVVHDLPKCPAPLKTGNSFFYLRFHGEDGRYRGGYDNTVLQRYATTIKQWLAEGKAGYCYFNNTMGDAFANATTLWKMVNE